MTNRSCFGFRSFLYCIYTHYSSWWWHTRQMSSNIRLRLERDEAHNLRHLHFSSRFPSYPSKRPKTLTPNIIRYHVLYIKQEILFVMIYVLYFTLISLFIRVSFIKHCVHQSIFNQFMQKNIFTHLYYPLNLAETIFFDSIAEKNKNQHRVSYWYKAKV